MKKKVSILFSLMTLFLLGASLNSCVNTVENCGEPIECNSYTTYSELTCSCICSADITTIQECETSGDYRFDIEECQCKPN